VEWGSLAADDCHRSCVEDIPDQVLMRLISVGNQQALGCLFQRYVKIVRSIAFRILRHAGEAEEMAQDFFLFIRRKCGIFDSTKSSARSWIIQMAYHRAIERRRYLATRGFYDCIDSQAKAERLVGTPTDENDYCPEAVFGRNGLQKVVDTLSADQRETLRLYFFEGYTLAEISEKLGQTVRNVRNHYYRGLDKLRKAILPRSLPVAERRER